MLLSIIIVNYNVKYFTEQCLHAVFRSRGIDMEQVEVFIVDNDSKDGSAPYLRKQFPRDTYPRLRLINNKRNVGFGRANNQAVRQARGKYILFLNPDTLITEHTLSDVLTMAAGLTRLGAIGVKMIHSNGSFARESRRGLPTPWVAFCKMAGLNALFPKSKTFGGYYMQYIPASETSPIDIVSGAFMLIPHEALAQTGCFDEKFFMYGEDIDLSYRLLLQGFHNHYCPTPILHYKGESTHKNTYRYVHVFYEAMLIFFQKHYPRYNLLLSLPVKGAIILRGLLALLMQQRHHLHRFLSPRRSSEPQHLLYLGHHSESIQEIAEAYDLNIDCIDCDEHTRPQGHLSLSMSTAPYLHIVYDLHDFTTGCILALFEQQTDRRHHIGTFNPQLGILITGSQTYTLDTE